MKKTFIIALVVVATVLAVGCKKEDNTFRLPGTSWAFDLETSLMGTTVIINDTLNIIDDHSLNRGLHMAAAGMDKYKQTTYNYLWNDTVLTLLDSVGQPTSMVFTYRESDNVFFRDPGDDPEMGRIFQMMGITETAYKQIK